MKKQEEYHIDDYLLLTNKLLNDLMDDNVKTSTAKEINSGLRNAAQFLKTKVIYGVNRKKGESMDSIDQLEPRNKTE